MFRGYEIDSTFLPSTPIGQSPVIAARFQRLRKVQHHLKSNACWPASLDLEVCDERKFFIRFKSSMGAGTKPGEKDCKWVIAGQIEVKTFCDDYLSAAKAHGQIRF